ncbi:Hypothetical protein CINCED_3A011064 [Cinara cedri]|uniref:Uncharacterized protein n=1 Tax=Cinara cedri TaxID=506608 RepID=A0A5E4MUU7_9HEMI|nr:Hypothetical protein CINCED_3A011064 [Cinara cedri]
MDYHKSRVPIWHAETQSELVEYLCTRRWEQSKIRNRDLIKEPFKKNKEDATTYFTNGGMVDSPLCECGEMQTIKHMVELYPITMFKEGLTKLHEGGPTQL